jgi:hypothetical protein
VLLLFDADTSGFNAFLDPGCRQAEGTCQLVYRSPLFVVGIEAKGKILVIE